MNNIKIVSISPRSGMSKLSENTLMEVDDKLFNDMVYAVGLLDDVVFSGMTNAERYYTLKNVKSFVDFALELLPTE